MSDNEGFAPTQEVQIKALLRERDELRAACAAMEKALRECRDRLRHSLTDRESCDVCRVIDAALQDTETP